MALHPPAPTGPLVVHSRVPLNAETSAELLCRSDRTPVPTFFVRSHGDIPDVDPGTWRLSVDGDVRTPLYLSLADLRAGFPRSSVEAALACAGNRRSEAHPPEAGIPWRSGAIGNTVWTGTRLADVLGAAGLGPGAAHVAFTGADRVDGEEYAGSVPVAKAVAPEVLLASEMDGAQLTAEHGYPLRVVVPGWIGARSVKWLTRVTAQREPSRSFFQREDYTVDGVQLTELPVTSAVCRPGDDPLPVTGGTVRLEGWATGQGGLPVDRVEVSCDGGRTWSRADLLGGARPWTWRRWRAEVAVPPTATEIVVRAVDRSGACQPEHQTWAANPRGYLTSTWPRVPVAGAGTP